MIYLLRVAFLTLTCLFVNAETLPIIKNVGPLVITEIEGMKFLIDSGSNANFIDSRSLGKLSEKMVRVEARDKYVNTFSGKTKSESYDLNLNVGSLKFLKMESYVMNTNKFTQKSDDIDCCDGILGMPFIKKYPMKIDIIKKTITIDQSFKNLNELSLKELKFRVVGKDTIVLDCKVNGVNLNFRLDTGSEAPLIYHKPVVDKYSFREQMFAAGYSGSGLPFFSSDDFNCGANKFNNLLSTYFYGQGGALTHDGVDGNMGGYILGNKYIFDMKNTKIFISKNPLSFPYASKTFKADLSFKNKNIGHPSINSQALALILKSCSEKSDSTKCLKKLLELERAKSKSLSTSSSIIHDFINYYFQIKTPDCSIDRLENELRAKPVQYNFCWYKLFEINNKLESKEDLEIKLPKKFKSLESSLDISRIEDIYNFTKNYYCVAIYNKIITSKDIPASLFALSIKGITISEESEKGYEKWILTKEGIACSENVKNTVGEFAALKINEFKNKRYLVKINPWTLLGDGVENFEKNLEKVITHELLHVYYAKHDGSEQYSRSLWAKLSKKEQQIFIKNHPSYNFNKEDILLREFFAYGHEKSEELPSFLSQ